MTVGQESERDRRRILKLLPPIDQRSIHFPPGRRVFLPPRVRMYVVSISHALLFLLAIRSISIRSNVGRKSVEVPIIIRSLSHSYTLRVPIIILSFHHLSVRSLSDPYIHGDSDQLPVRSLSLRSLAGKGNDRQSIGASNEVVSDHYRVRSDYHSNRCPPPPCLKIPNPPSPDAVLIPGSRLSLVGL